MIYSVSNLVAQLRNVLEDNFPDVHVEGEISGFTRSRAGHLYFDLKDAKTQVRCVMFRTAAARVRFPAGDGLHVRLRGAVTVYANRGSMQLRVTYMELVGEGALQKAIAALRQQLASEGLFANDRKRPLPAFPNVIGVVTSGHGAAQHDIRSILGRRFPFLRVVLCPVRVQGDGAAEEIAQAIAAFNALAPDDGRRPDVLIIGRGGGSPEDLAAFSDERVARALFASMIPTVSAVGHESDTCIADLVADRCAATPSMAAEIVVPDRRSIARTVREQQGRLVRGLHRRIRHHQLRITGLAHRFRKPQNLVERAAQRLDQAIHRLTHSGSRIVHDRRTRLFALRQNMEAFSPSRPLERGYVRVEHDGAPVARAAHLRAGDRVELCFLDASLPARIEHA